MHYAGNEGSKRISLIYGHTVDSCHALCNSLSNCVEFAFGMVSWYKDRCDLFKEFVLSYNTAWCLDIYLANRGDEGM